MQLMDLVNSAFGTLNGLMLVHMYLYGGASLTGWSVRQQQLRNHLSQSPQTSLSGGKVQIAIVNSFNTR